MNQSDKSRKVYLQTFGCQMNEYDSDKLMEQLSGADYSRTEEAGEADLILINTCAIREKSEHKVYSLLGTLGQLKETRPHLKIGVGGCVAQQKGAEILKRVKTVDLVFGTDSLFDLPEMLDQVAGGDRVINTEWASRKRPIENFVPDFNGAPLSGSPVKASIAITKGCNNFCTFCVVPYTRGREVSREPDNILAEARTLVGKGIREITLLGQNVNSYRAGGVRFVDLLSRLNELEGLERIRYISPHPKDMKPELAMAHRDLKKLCEHMHLPFQSGSDTILEAMRRNHRIDAYLEKIREVRDQVPDMAFSTDVIVGFPGETEADFEATLEVLRQVRFDHIYAFKFSSRQDTPAAQLPGHLPDEIKSERLARLHDLHDRILGESQQKMVGCREEVLLEGTHPKIPGAMNGRTRGNKSTVVMDCDRKPGELATVEIISTRKYSLVGREIS